MVGAFDFVGCEDKGVQPKELKELTEYMRNESEGMLKLTLHIGETSWNDGTVTPAGMNAIDAQELNPDRIAHNNPVNRNAKLSDALKRQEPKVPVEICIISNMFLGYCQDPRNHHVCFLESSPMFFVLGTDSPGIQGSSMTDEWALYALASSDSNWPGGQLSMTCRRLAERSIECSFFPPDIKQSMLQCLQEDWEGFYSIMAQNMDDETGPAPGEKFTNLPRRNEHFVGRETELGQLLNAAMPGAALLVAGIHGQGGIGKTELALEFAYRLNRRITWFVRAATNLKADLCSLAVRLKLVDKYADEDFKLARLNAYMETNSDWALVLDNVDDEMLPILLSNASRQQGLIVVTARDGTDTSLHGLLRFILEPFTEDEAVQLILSITGHHDHDAKVAAREIATRFHCFPLALGHVAAHIKETGVDLRQFLSDVERLPPNKKFQLNQDRYGKSMDQVIRLIFRRRRFDTGPQDILLIMSYLDPDFIQRSVIEDIARVQGTSKHVDSILEKLRQQSLIIPVNCHEQGEAYRMHRITMEILRSIQQQQQLARSQILGNVLRALLQRFAGLLSMFDLEEELAEIGPHLQAFFQQVETLPEHHALDVQAKVGWGFWIYRQSFLGIDREMARVKHKLEEALLVCEPGSAERVACLKTLAYLEGPYTDKALDYMLRAIDVPADCREHDELRQLRLSVAADFSFGHSNKGTEVAARFIEQVRRGACDERNPPMLRFSCHRDLVVYEAKIVRDLSAAQKCCEEAAAVSRECTGVKVQQELLKSQAFLLTRLAQDPSTSSTCVLRLVNDIEPQVDRLFPEGAAGGSGILASLGLALYQLGPGYYQRSLELYDKAHATAGASEIFKRAQPTYGFILTHRGVLHMKLLDYVSSERDLAEASRIWSTRNTDSSIAARCNLELALCYYALAQPDEAQSCFETAEPICRVLHSEPKLRLLLDKVTEVRRKFLEQK
ncbi:unnamed protein product [Polarella glacialis]|uniref:Adenosine deaminase domain-containing protein n=1 Tax=Polarella glacialis TaxID=89957 RepID=A0A813DL22_POLGL|nr:unnamed protein product [Polarella glacialis]